MRHGLVAFGITTAVLVPAALDRLTAGSAQIARLAAPGARTVTIGGARIDVALDRAIVDAGDRVHVTLTAPQALARKVTVAVLLMEQSGSGGERVESPPQRMARELVTFAPGAAGAHRTLALRLRGRREQQMDGVAPFGRYTILVMAPAAADRLEQLRRRALRAGPADADDADPYYAWAGPYYAIGGDVEQDAGGDGDPDEDGVAAVIGKPGEAARLDVLTRPADSPVALRTPDTATRGQPFTVAVTVKNRSKHPIRHLGVRLGTPPLYGLESKALADEQLAITPALATIDLGARQSAQVSFQVTASAIGTAGLYASTSCDEADDWEACSALLDGQLDATEIVAPAEPPPPPAATTVALAPAGH